MGAAEIIAAAGVLVAALSLLLTWHRGRGEPQEVPRIEVPPVDRSQPPVSDQRAVALLEEAVLEMAKLGDIMAQIDLQLRGRPMSAFQSPRGKTLFEELKERGNTWVVKSQPLRWRIEDSPAGAAFEASMQAMIGFFNAVSMIKLESDDLPVGPTDNSEVGEYVRNRRQESQGSFETFQDKYAEFRAEARKMAGLSR